MFIIREYWRPWLFGVGLPLIFCLGWVVLLAAPDNARFGPFEFWLRRYQALIAGLLGLAGGFLAYRGVRAQIESSERQHWRVVNRPLIDRLAKCMVSNGRFSVRLRKTPPDDLPRLRRLVSNADMGAIIGNNGPELADLILIKSITNAVKETNDAFRAFNNAVNEGQTDSRNVSAAKQRLFDALDDLRKVHQGIRRVLQSGVPPDEVVWQKETS